jgi:malate/lactate dehydrogenase
VLNRSGVREIVELKLTADEQAALKKSADSIKENIAQMNQLLVAV